MVFVMFLSADDVKALFTNKTSKRKWWLEENKHCTIHPKRGDSCKFIKAGGDGAYHGITDGKHTHTLSNFRDGENFNK